MGPLPVSVTISPQATAIATGQTVQFQAALVNDTAVTWITTAGTIDSTGLFTAPVGLSTTITVTATSKADPTKSASATVNVVTPGTVTATANPQVASYSIAPAAAGNVSVQFGLDNSYGLTTWQQPVPTGGGPVSLFVAGMKGNTLYHMRGVVAFGDGSQYTDPDMTFTTQAYAAAELPSLTVTTTPGMTPQSGVELLAMTVGGGVAVPLVSDLNGNVLWSYNSGLTNEGIYSEPIKLLPNGHFLINYSYNAPSGGNSVLQEVDLAGTIIWQMRAKEVGDAIAAATGCGGDGCDLSNYTFVGTHHDFVLLPNGHLILLGSIQSTQAVPGMTVTGDIIIDLDQNHKPVWLWNEFNHLDINRRPMQFPDWTHTNAVVYSADDGNLIISIRHQNWLVKVDYANGSGPGDILWKLGYQGDFTLAGGTDPTDWFYAQHGPSFVTTNTTGKFTLTLFDNGDDRVFPSGVTCNTTGGPRCQYSTVPVIDMDETAKTATLTMNAMAPTYSFFGGNSEVLKNGNVEYCESSNGAGGDIYEVTQSSTPETVWHLRVGGQFPYRGQRIPSLYSGVQW